MYISTYCHTFSCFAWCILHCITEPRRDSHPLPAAAQADVLAVPERVGAAADARALAVWPAVLAAFGVFFNLLGQFSGRSVI